MTDQNVPGPVPPSNPESEAEEGEDPLETILIHVGEMGRYQKFLFMSTLPFGFLFAFVYFGQMFITATPQRHWCWIPELKSLSPAMRRNLSTPGNDESWDPCVMYDIDYSKMLTAKTPPKADTATVPCKNGWEFELNDIPYPTVVSERGWVCEHSKNAPLAQTIFCVGALVGGLTFGWLADHAGRLPALIGANVVACIGGVLTIYSSGFWDFVACRFIVGISFDNCFMLIYILVLEYVGPHHRTWVANMSMALFFGSGCVAVPWVALWANNWRTFVISTSLPLLMAVFTPLVIPESARWMSSRGQVHRAIKVLKKFERVNRTHIPQKDLDAFVVSCQETKERESLRTLMKSALMRRTLVLMVVTYMGTTIVFDSLVRLSESLGLDFFITFALSSATEIPSTALLAALLDRGGRRLLTSIPLVVCSCLMLIAAWLPKGIPQAALSVMARFAVSMSYSAIVQWATEILPTGMRASGSALVHVNGFFAIMFSPFIVYSERVWHGLPMIIVGLMGFFSAALAMLLPETCGQAMPQTVEDGEKLVEQFSLLSRMRRRPGERKSLSQMLSRAGTLMEEQAQEKRRKKLKVAKQNEKSDEKPVSIERKGSTAKTVTMAKPDDNNP